MKVKKIREWKISTKITTLYLVLSALLLSVLIPVVYVMVENSLRDSLSANMQISAATIAEAITEEHGKLFVDPSTLERNAVRPGVYLRVVDQNEQTVYQSRDAQWIFQVVGHEEDAEKDWSYLTQSKTIGGQTVQIQTLGSIYFNDFLNDFLWILLLMIPCYLLLAAIGSKLLAKRALQPVRQITETAKKISEGDLSERIDGISSQDEVGELADTFNRMLEELEVSFQRERQFTSDASHELRTPMTVITACTEDALYTDDETIRTENLQVIQKENQRMTKMLAQLLMLSRGYEGRYHFQPETLCLYDMVESVSESLSAMAETKGIQIHNEIPESYLIHADQSLFTQLLVNLIENAVKYGNQDGNIWVTLEKAENIQKSENVQYQLCVSDDGIGISEEDLPKIFERFYRADKARDRNGSGLGLSIVKWIATLHGGEIRVESKLGKGTKMIVAGF